MFDFLKIFQSDDRAQLEKALAELESRAEKLRGTIADDERIRRGNAVAAMSGDQAARRRIEGAERAADHARRDLARVEIAIEEARAGLAKIDRKEAEADRRRREKEYRALVKRRAGVAARADELLADLAPALQELLNLGTQIVQDGRALRPDLTRSQSGHGFGAPLPMAGANSSMDWLHIWERLIRAMEHHGLLDHLPSAEYKLHRFLALTAPEGGYPSLVEAEEREVHKAHLDLVLAPPDEAAPAALDHSHRGVPDPAEDRPPEPADQDENSAGGEPPAAA